MGVGAGLCSQAVTLSHLLPERSERIPFELLRAL